MSYARIAVNLPAVSGEFDYRLPPELAGQVGIGHLVTVPFGMQTVQGVVMELVPQPAVVETKAVLDLLDPLPVLTAAQVELARQLARETLNPLAAIIGLMIPPGLNQQSDSLWALADGASLPDSGGDVQKRIFQLLQARGALRGRQIDRHFGPQEWRKTADAMLRRGMLTKRSVLAPPTARPKFIRTAQLAVEPDAAEAAMPDLGKTPATQERRARALDFLIREPDAVNVAWVYAESGCNLADLQELAERELIVLSETEIFRDPLQKAARMEPLPPVLELTAEQQSVLGEVLSAFTETDSARRTFLLHGVTGSGKTEIYLRAAAEALRRGRQALILVPEIALTPQTVRRFTSRFPGQVGLVHSRLSAGERYDTWRRARAGQLKVIIGARSALFAPLANVGLIVADECHDHSYYQSEPPFYSAVDAALLYGKLSGAVTVLGSATPPVVLRHRAESGSLRLLELRQRVTGLGSESGAGLPPVSIIDMREELKAGNRGIFSRELSESLAEVLNRGEQAILYLNRRGTATYVFCRDCGHVVKCPRCDTPLTLHTDSARSALTCHRCAYTRQMPQTCLACGGRQIRSYGLGSEKVETEVQALFPQARTLRWDWDTTREKDAHELILAHFANHQADVLVGTQMLAKGLDLPLVTLVGVVLADVGLTLPDPFAGERAFQLLTQVAGRAGRSARGGKVVMQTFMPENAQVQFAAGHDYAGFYAAEIADRHRLVYPPFSRLVRLEARHADPTQAESAALEMAKRLKGRIQAEKRSETDVVGPAPCFFARVNGQSRWQVILRGPAPADLLTGFDLNAWRVEVDPPSLL